MTLAELKAVLANGFRPPVEVVGIETLIYRLRLRLGQKLVWIEDETGASLVFPSSTAACRALWDLGLRKATLVTDGYWDAEVGGGSDPGLRHSLSFTERP
ncbi:hypothetical protein PVT67_15375 [Gallaecimonas kandeliae]|uniref:hypothetical protein n=1 Tax=Gallaecimonas kandeliae TaxID=3029055 RepID=UPI00264A3E75|nr:hypothetical protein [Gallaecimonas kandeliae]WKE65025.1 hypothetical protein PVT67_15375 [Gallaecimonas kandeliae]